MNQRQCRSRVSAAEAIMMSHALSPTTISLSSSSSSLCVLPLRSLFSLLVAVAVAFSPISVPASATTTPWYDAFEQKMVTAESLLDQVADEASSLLSQGACPELAGCPCSPSACGGDLSDFSCSPAGDFGNRTDICGCLPGQWINYQRSVVALPANSDMFSVDSQNFVCRTAALDTTFKSVFLQATSLALTPSEQIFRFRVANHEGIVRSFPGEVRQINENTCANFDIRRSPAFITAITGAKNVVIMMPITESIVKMDFTLVPPTSLLDRIKPAVSQLLDSFHAQDYIMVMRYAVGRTESISFPDITQSVPATPANIDTFKNDVMSRTLGLGGGFPENWPDAFKLAFDFLDANAVQPEGTGCKNIIIFITDGSSITNPGHETVISARQQQLIVADAAPAHIFVYTIGNKVDHLTGQPVAPVHAPEIACQNDGFWAHITAGENAVDIIGFGYPRFFYDRSDSRAPRWSNPYVNTDVFDSVDDGQGTRISVGRVIETGVVAESLIPSLGGVSYRLPLAIATVDIRIPDYDDLTPADRAALFAGLQTRSQQLTKVNGEKERCDQTSGNPLIERCRSQVARNAVSSNTCPSSSSMETLSECNADRVLVNNYTVELLSTGGGGATPTSCSLDATRGLNAALCNAVDPTTSLVVVPHVNEEFSTLCCNRIAGQPRKQCTTPTESISLTASPSLSVTVSLSETQSISEHSTSVSVSVPIPTDTVSLSNTDTASITIPPTPEPTSVPTLEPTVAPTEAPTFTFGSDADGGGEGFTLNPQQFIDNDGDGGSVSEAERNEAAAAARSLVQAGVPPKYEDGQFDRMTLPEALRVGQAGFVFVLVGMFGVVAMVVSALFYHGCSQGGYGSTNGRVAVVEDKIPLVNRR